MIPLDTITDSDDRRKKPCGWKVYGMERFLVAVVIGTLAWTQLSLGSTKPTPQTNAPSTQTSKSASSALPPLPPPPAGQTTVIGGTIRHVDPVADEIQLNVFGGKKMTILYDQRTKYFRNGVRTPLADLHPEHHASVETVLDGTSIFAVSIHVLSHAPEGELQGQVLNYTPGNHKLTLKTALSGESMELQVPVDTPIVRTGQNASASGAPALVAGDLVSVQFQSSNNGRGVAKKIEILATPGSKFTFRGTVSFLDMGAGKLAVTDPRDGRRYTIFFDPARLPASRKLHRGAQVTVDATFNGTHYEADTIAID